MNHKTKLTNNGIAEHPREFLGRLAESWLFSNLSDAEVTRFHNAAQTRRYEKCTILYHQDTPAECFYIISEGWVKLFHTTPKGEEVIVDMLTTGDMFGESAIFEHGRHMCGAQVVEDARLLCIPSLFLKDQIQRCPKLALSLLASMSRHHRHRHAENALNAVDNTSQRVGRFLLKLCPQNKRKSIVFHLPYDKMLIAHSLGMNIATFSRTLNILRQKASIHISGMRVEIDSLEILTKFVHGTSDAKHSPKKT